MANAKAGGKGTPKHPKVVFLNPRTCGIYKSGGTRYKTDPKTGLRTNTVDNELDQFVTAYLTDQPLAGKREVPLDEVYGRGVLVPTYYDDRYSAPIRDVLKREGVEAVTIGELLKDEVISVRGGHGSPGNDQRSGHIPYIKVSDIRALRVNVNPTNLVSEGVAKRFWGHTESGLRAWDLITPNRASSNIGEFAILLPGEEQIVLTKEVFVLRVEDDEVYDPFYLLWALCLSAVREQWRRIALMQTNREDCGNRYKEIALPKPPSKQWAQRVSKPFRDYFSTIADGKANFAAALNSDRFAYVASASLLVSSDGATDAEDSQEDRQ